MIKSDITKIILATTLSCIVVLFPKSVIANTYLWENLTWQSDLTNVSRSSLSLGDIDNDNDLDLILTGNCIGSSCWATKIYINNGTKLIESPTWQSDLVEVEYGSTAFGDVDNDGDLDLALIGCYSALGGIDTCPDSRYTAKIYINNGTSLVENSTWQNNLKGTERGVIAFGDIDNDGKLDLALTGNTNISRITKIFINNGTSLVENYTWSSELPQCHQSSLALGDIDNDGRLDMVLSGDRSIFYTGVFINNGTSLVENYTWQQSLMPLEDGSIALGDYDNDGDLDMTIIGCCDHHHTYRNNGTTFNKDQLDIHCMVDQFGGVFAGSVIFGDYDNEGSLDMITSGREQYTFFYVNNGTGNYSSYLQDPETGIMNVEKGSQVFGDLDNDNDLDLVIVGTWGNDQAAKVYINNITTSNANPSPSSSGFDSTYSNDKLTLNWGSGSDTETPTLGLYYNLRAGTCSGCHDVISGVYGGGDDNGYFGNMMQRKSIVLDRQFNDGQTIYWAVQTIDTGLAKSPWSTEQTYTINLGATTTTSSTTSSTTTTTQQITTTTSGSSSPPGPSNGGGTPTTTTPTEAKTEKTYSSITPQSPKTITESDLASSNTGLTEIYIDVKEPVTTVEITIQLATEPSVAIAAGQAYKYMEITKQNLDDDNIEEAKISFKVNKSWITDNSIDADTILLNRLVNNTWEKLSTTKTGETDTHISYEATTPGFSYFAITGDLVAGATTSTTQPATTITTTTTATTAPTTSTEQPSGTPTTLFVAIIVIAASILAVFYVKKRKTSLSGVDRL